VCVADCRHHLIINWLLLMFTRRLVTRVDERLAMMAAIDPVMSTTTVIVVHHQRRADLSGV